MRAQSTHYLDLRKGDVLKIQPSNLELEVSKVGRKALLISSTYNTGNGNPSTIQLERGQYIALHEGPKSLGYRTKKIGGIYNFGSRHHGKRNHVRVELGEGYSFSHSKANRKTEDRSKILEFG